MAGETLIKALEQYAPEDLEALRVGVLVAREQIDHYRKTVSDPTLRIIIGQAERTIDDWQNRLLEDLGRHVWNMYLHYKAQNELAKREQADANDQ